MISNISRNLASLTRAIVSAISSLCSRISAFANRIFSRQDEGFATLERQISHLNASAARGHWREVDAGLGIIETDLPSLEGGTRARFDRSESKALRVCDKIDAASRRIFQ